MIEIIAWAKVVCMRWQPVDAADVVAKAKASLAAHINTNEMITFNNNSRVCISIIRCTRHTSLLARARCVAATAAMHL